MSFFSFIFHIFLFSSCCYRWICSKTPIKSYSFGVISYIPANKILKKICPKAKGKRKYTHSPFTVTAIQKYFPPSKNCTKYIVKI